MGVPCSVSSTLAPRVISGPPCRRFDEMPLKDGAIAQAKQIVSTAPAV
jgi:hypothetical protein